MKNIHWHARTKGWSNHLVLGILGLILTLPVLWVFLSSFKTRTELNAYPMKFLPETINIARYLGIFTYADVSPVLLRTFVLGITTAVITCVTSAMAGYAFARLRSPWRKPLFSLVIAMLIVPNIIMLIPQFILYSRYHLINTYWPWYLAALGATNPLFIFMYRQFFLGFPKELEEAAEIDGASPAGIFLKIILPNSRPALATLLIFAFNAVWGDFLTPTMFLNNPAELMGPLLGSSPVMHPFFFALAIVYSLPIILLFSLIQKNIQKGMLFTGLRG